MDGGSISSVLPHTYLLFLQRGYFSHRPLTDVFLYCYRPYRQSYTPLFVYVALLMTLTSMQILLCSS
jgi:hypothetical protein